MTEFVGRFKNEISGPAREAKKDVLALRDAAVAAGSAIKKIGGPRSGAGPTGRGTDPSGPSTSPTGSGGPRSAGGPDREAEKQRREAERKRREEIKSREYVSAIRDRHLAAEWKQQEQKEKEAIRSAERAEKAKAAARAKANKPPVKTEDKTLGRIEKAAKFAAVGIGASAVGQLALGHRGMERLTAITARAKLNIRGLFSGVNPKPFLDTFERVSLLFSKQTVTGRAMAGILSRLFNGIGGAVNGAEPFILDFFKGIVQGVLRAQIAWLRLRIAILPVTEAIGKLFNTVGVGATLGQAAVGLLTIKMGWALLRFLKITALIKGAASLLGKGGGAGAAAEGAAAGGGTLGAAAVVGTAAGAYLVAKQNAPVGAANASAREGVKSNEDLLRSADKFIKDGRGASAEFVDTLKARRDAIRAQLDSAEGVDYSGYGGAAVGLLHAAVGKRSFEEQREAEATNANRGMLEGQRKQIDAAIGALSVSTSAAGKSAGDALGAGMIEGMKDREGAVRAGGAAIGAAAAEGVRSKDGLDAHSPSRKTTQSGRDAGKGVILGMQQEKAAVERAAAKALVPEIPGGAGVSARPGAAAGLPALPPITINLPQYLGAREELRFWLRSELTTTLHGLLLGMGAGPAGT